MNKLNTFSITLMLSAAAVAGFLAYSFFSARGNDEPRFDGSFSVAPQTNKRPTFSLSDPFGTMVSSDEWAGRPLIVNFWATWCAPCRREIPLLKELADENSDRNLQIVGIALDFADAVADYSAEMQIDYPILVGDQDAMDVAAAFGMDLFVLPATAISDSSGHIITVHIGELHADQAAIMLDVLWRIEAGELSQDDGRSEIDTRLKQLAEVKLAAS